MAGLRPPADGTISEHIPRGMRRILIRTRLDANPRFAELWREGSVGGHAEDHKTVRHPSVGDIHVDCDVLTHSDTDLKIVVFTVAPGSEDESKLDLARVAGAARV